MGSKTKRSPVDDVRVAHMGPVTMSDGKPGFGMTLTGAREVIHRMAEASVTFFEGEGGVNYVEFTVHHDTKGSFVHRIQRLEGKTPHELRREAEAERNAERSKSAELAAALVQLQRDLVVMQQARDEAQEALQQQIDRRVETMSERDALHGEVLGLQRMLEEALKPGFHAPGLCLGCHRSFTERGLKLHAKHCRKLPVGAGRA